MSNPTIAVYSRPRLTRDQLNSLFQNQPMLKLYPKSERYAIFWSFDNLISSTTTEVPRSSVDSCGHCRRATYSPDQPFWFFGGEKSPNPLSPHNPRMRAISKILHVIPWNVFTASQRRIDSWPVLSSGGSISQSGVWRAFPIYHLNVAVKS